MTDLSEKPTFKFQAFGHPNITATHPTTIEVTSGSQLTPRGDCIIGVRASCGASGLPARLKRLLSSDSGKARFRFRVGPEIFEVSGRGSSSLTFQNPHEMVLRKSGYASGRTVMVHIDRAAIDIPESMVRLLKNPEQRFEIEISTT
jgi:hypothetical protein